MIWVAVGYPVNDEFAREIGRLLRLDVSFVSRLAQGEWKLQASTLGDEEKRCLGTSVPSDSGSAMTTATPRTAMRRSRVMALPAHTDDTVEVVLQQPLTTAMEPFRRLSARACVDFASRRRRCASWRAH